MHVLNIDIFKMESTLPWKRPDVGLKKRVKRKQVWYISITQNLSQIRNF